MYESAPEPLMNLNPAPSYCQPGPWMYFNLAHGWISTLDMHGFQCEAFMDLRLASCISKNALELSEIPELAQFMRSIEQDA